MKLEIEFDSGLSGYVLYILRNTSGVLINGKQPSVLYKAFLKENQKKTQYGQEKDKLFIEAINSKT